MGLQNNHFCSTFHGEAPFNAKRHSTQAPQHAGSERGYPQSRQALELLIQSQADRTATEDDPVCWLEIYLGEIRKGLTPESAVASLATSFETSEEDTLVNLMVDAHSLLHDAGCEERDTITTLLGLFNALAGQAGTKPSFTEWDDEESDDDPPLEEQDHGQDEPMAGFRHSEPPQIPPFLGQHAEGGSTSAGPDFPRFEARAGAPAPQAVFAPGDAHADRETARALAAVTKEIGNLRRLGEDSGKYNEGTLSYLGCPLARFIVYLARACDLFEVTICQHMLGRDLYNDLRTSADIGRTALAALNCPI